MHVKPPIDSPGIAPTPRLPPAATADGAPAVEAIHLSKRYEEVEAVRDATFTVAPGEVFAFLGPNGAGKSTTINMLCTLARPTGGRARVAGFDVERQPKAVRRRIGLVFQEQTLDQQLTAEENLRFHAVLYGIPSELVAPRIDRVLELVALTERRSDLVANYSGGMARRLEIARGMLHTPTVLFLDEPTLGLDPQTRALMWEDVLRLRAEEGVTVFLTTHYMEEAEYADRIAIIDYGRIVALDTPDNLRGARRLGLGGAADRGRRPSGRRAGCRGIPRRADGERDPRVRRRRRVSSRPSHRHRRRPGAQGPRASPDARRRLPPLHGARDP